MMLVLFKIHGSSIGMWDHYIKDKQDPNQISLIAGKNRDIRSDEWLVQTPWVMSQINNPHFFAIKNDNIRSDGQNMLIPNIPVLSLDLIGKPYYWGFILLGKDYGISWYWVLRVMLFVWLSYEIAFFLSNGNRRLSLLGAIWIGLSPAIMWWYNTAVVDVMICAQGIIVSALFYVRNFGRWRLRLLLMLLFSMSLIGFASSLYPAVQVPLGYLVFIFLSYIFYPHIKKIIQSKMEAYFALFCFVLVTASISLFVYNSYEDIKLMMNTVYPGKRVSTGGNFNILELQNYVTNWLTPFRDITFSNNSEISGFYNFLPALLLTIIVVFRLESKNRKLIYLIFGYLVLQLSWMIISFPKIFSIITLFSYVTEQRLNLVLGLTSVYLSIWLASVLERHKPFSRLESIILCSLIGLFYMESIYHTEMIGFFHNKLALLTVIILVILNYLLLMGNIKIFTIIMTIIIFISGAVVNPIATGTGAIYNKKIAQQIMSINEEDPNQKWAATNSIVNGQYLIALGVKSFNSVHDYPDFSMWRKLDPNGKYTNIYNRYAHVKVYFTNTPTLFKLEQADVVSLFLNIGDIKLTGIKYVLSPDELPDLLSIGAKEIYYNEVDHLHIYKLNT
jgi:hypothetical protein